MIRFMNITCLRNCNLPVRLEFGIMRWCLLENVNSQISALIFVECKLVWYYSMKNISFE